MNETNIIIIVSLLLFTTTIGVYGVVKLIICLGRGIYGEAVKALY
jgi:hypothetical protein